MNEEPIKRKVPLTLMAEAIKELAEAVKKLEEKIDKNYKQPIIREEEEKEIPIIQAKDATVPTKVIVPKEWRDIIDGTLNFKFNVDVEYRSDACFELTIFVPREYSGIKENEWQLSGGDRRVKVINNYLGASGVKDYCDLIVKNLGSETMRKVIEDRIKI